MGPAGPVNFSFLGLNKKGPPLRVVLFCSVQCLEVVEIYRALAFCSSSMENSHLVLWGGRDSLMKNSGS